MVLIESFGRISAYITWRVPIGFGVFTTCLTCRSLSVMLFTEEEAKKEEEEEEDEDADMGFGLFD